MKEWQGRKSTPNRQVEQGSVEHLGTSLFLLALIRVLDHTPRV